MLTTNQQFEIMDLLTKGNNMKIYTKTFHGIEVKAYNDSNVEWVVYSKNFSYQRFDMKKFTMKAAMEFYTQLYRGGNG